MTFLPKTRYNYNNCFYIIIAQREEVFIIKISDKRKDALIENTIDIIVKNHLILIGIDMEKKYECSKR